MKRIVLIILMLTLFTIASNAQTVEFNRKRGKYIVVDGANIYYEEIENAGKPTLLFMQGGFGNITVPTLIIRSNDDGAFPLESAVELTTKIKTPLFFNILFAPHDALNIRKFSK